MEALGLIENRSFLSSIVAADTALKAADVTLMNVEIIKGGYVTVQLIGDVAAVKAAVEAGSGAVDSFGTLVSSHVIPRMHTETHQLVKKLSESQDEVLTDSPSVPPTEQDKASNLLEDKQELEEKVAEPIEKAPSKMDGSDTPTQQGREKVESGGDNAEAWSREELEKMTVGKLRQLVRMKKTMNNNTKSIKYAKKTELIKSLLEHQKKQNEDNEN